MTVPRRERYKLKSPCKPSVYKGIFLGVPVSVPVCLISQKGISSLVSPIRLTETRIAQKHIGWPKGLDVEKLAKVRKALEKGLSMAKTGVSAASASRATKCLQVALGL